MTIERSGPPAAAELGLMEGSPPSADRLVTLENWLLPPFNRWSLQHLGELMPSARIARGEHVRELPRAERDLGDLTFEHDGERWTLEETLAATATDGFAVLRGGEIVTERYANGLTPETRHVQFSVTKSVVATLAGILIDRGAMHADDDLSAVIPELAGTSWEGATVQHVLDMRTGTRFSEDYDDLESAMAPYTVASGMGPRTHPDEPTDTYSYLLSLENDREHGGAFDYRSPVTSMLGWLCERAGGARLGTLLGREVWAPIGAEHDASIAVDPHGYAMAAGGMSATLRDLARFGQAWLDGGVVEGRQVIPSAWIADTLTGQHDSREAYAAALTGEDAEALPAAFYRNKWWVLDPSLPLYTGIGIHGQYVTVHGPSRVVIAKFSSLPVADDLAFEGLHLAAFLAVAGALA
jgi:CubicO group peptidase (beta-lactamase class C family)